VEFFVGGVTARSAADLARVNRKTGTYFFHRLRELIARQLDDSLPVEGSSRWMRAILGAFAKANAGAAPPARSPSSASSNAAARSPP
jgi:transposase